MYKRQGVFCGGLTASRHRGVETEKIETRVIRFRLPVFSVYGEFAADYFFAEPCTAAAASGEMCIRDSPNTRTV